MTKLGAFEIFIYIGILSGVGFLTLPKLIAFSLTVGVLSSYVWYVIKRYKYFDEIGLPYAKALPFIGSIMDMKKMDGQHFVDMKWGPKLGKVYGSFLVGYEPDFVVWDPVLLKKVMVKDFNCFTNHRIGLPKSIRKAKNVDEYDLIHNMVSVAADDHWKNIRSSMTPVFSSGKLKNVFNMIDQKSPLLVEVLNDLGKNGTEDVDIKKILSGFTMNIIASVALAAEVDSLRNPDDPVVKHANSVNNISIASPKLLFTLCFPWLSIKLYDWFQIRTFKLPAEEYFKYSLDAALKQRIEGNVTSKNDFMQLMLNTRKHTDVDHDEGVGLTDVERRDSSLGKITRIPMTDEEIVANCFLFLVAGFDTSAATLNFVCYSLAVNQDIQQKCFDEIESVLKEKELNYADVMQNLPYLEAVILETLRMYPVAVTTDRLASVNYQLTEDITVPKGCAVRIPIYLIHHWEEYYPNPEIFDPDRFSPEEKGKRDPLLFLPFGYGPRSCVGLRFAMMEMKIVLVHMIKNFILRPSESTEVPLTLTSMNLLRPKKDIMLRFEPRK